MTGWSRRVLTVALATTVFAGSASGDVLLTAGDEVPGLGEVRGFFGQACASPDGALFVFAGGVEGKEGLICIDESGARAVVRTGDPAPPDRVFYDVEYGDCRFTEDGEVIFSASTLKPVMYSDGTVQLYVEAAIYRAGPDGIVRLLGTGDTTKSGGTLEFSSSASYSANSKGKILAHINYYDGYFDSGYFLVDETGIEKLFSGGPASLGTINGEFVRSTGELLLTDRGDIVSFARIGDTSDRHSNVVVEWSDGEARVVAAPEDIASDGLPYGRMTDLLVRGDVAVFKAKVLFDDPRGWQDRLFIFSPENPSPELVFAGAPVFIDTQGPISFANPIVRDANASGEILFESYSPETDVAYFTVQQGQEPQFATSRYAPYPLTFSDQGTIYSVVYPFPPESDPVITLEADLGMVAGTSCSILPFPMTDPGTPATMSPTRTATPAVDKPNEPDGEVECAGDCGGDGVVTVSDVVTVISIALGRSGLSNCSACDVDASGDVTIDEAIMAVNRALLGCR